MIRQWIVPVVLVALFCGCSAKKDADAVRDLIRKGAQLAEEKQIGELMKLTGDGFVAMPGQYNAMAVKGILFRAFLHYGVFRIHYPKPTVELLADAGAASATVYFLIVRQNQEIPGLQELVDDPRQWLETAGEKADLYRLQLQLKKTGAAWRVDQARLEGFKGTRF